MFEAFFVSDGSTTMIKDKAAFKHHIDHHAKKRFEDDIIKIEKPYLETERVLIGDSPALMWEIVDHVNNCKDIFVSASDSRIAPILPQGINVAFKPAIEITDPRERAYFLDAEGVLREMKCEVRQEIKPGFVKQTTKRGNGATKADSTMDRMEQASKLIRFGFNIFAVGDKKLRESLLENLQSVPRPVQRMISQRVRIPYHPEGNPDIRIEMAIEPIHVGQTFTGFVWQQPKIDLEIKVGPVDKDARHALLAREEERLLAIFPLRPQLKSIPTPGFDAIREDMEDAAVRARFHAIRPDERWWLDSAYALTLAA
jgi:hypothetical protein